MKKLISVFLVLFLLCSCCRVAFAYEYDFSTDLEKFTESISEMISNNEATVNNDGVANISDSVNSYFLNTSSQDIENGYSESSDTYTNRLIVKSSEPIEPLNAVGFVSGYNDLYVMQFENTEDFIYAYKYYAGMECVEFIQEDLFCSSQTIEETTEETTEETSNETIAEDSVLNPTQIQSDIFGFSALRTYLTENTISYSDIIDVAVLDSGVANDHPLFEGRIEPTGFNSIDTSDDCYDDYGHGTHVAGIIVANTLQNVTIKPYKVLDETGKGTDLSVYLGIEQAIADGVEIINLSLSRRGYSSLLYEAVTKASDSGVLIVASAGNNGVNLNQITYSPADFEEVITVASCTDDFFVSDFSNYGGETDIVAPGNAINSASLDGGYTEKSGTSMSAGFISAAVSYLLMQFPEYSRIDIETALYNNGKPCKAATGATYIFAEYLTREKEASTTPFFSYTKTLFTDPFELKITCEDETAEIYYTTSMMETGVYALYTEPIPVNHDLTVSAFTISKGSNKSSTSTYTYTRKAPTDTTVFTVDSNGVLTSYSGTDPDVVIPASVNGKYVYSVDTNAFKGNTEINSISFPGYTTSIPTSAFEGCTNLDFVRIKAVKTVGERAFYGCTDLIKVVSDNVNSVGDYAFFNCSNLHLYTFTSLSTVGVSAFEGTEKLFTIGSNSITVISDRAFCNSAITSLDLSLTTSVGDSAFLDCKNLQYISGPRLTEIGSNAFSGCNKIISIELDALTTLGDSAFSGNTNIEHFSGNSLTEIPDETFKNCEALVDISFNSVTSIGEYAFYNTAITSAVFDNVTAVGVGAFGSCENLIEVSFNKLSSVDFDMLLDSVGITSISFAKVTSITYDTYDEFLGLNNYFPNLTSFNMPLLETIPENMFKNCDSITGLTFTNLKSVGDYAFYNANIAEVSLTNVTDIGDYAFYNCDNISEVKIPLVENLGENAFSECDNIVTFSANLIKSFDVDILEKSKNSLVSLSLNSAESITQADNDNVLFKQFPNLQAFSANKLSSISDDSFKDCTALKSVYLASVENLGASAFENTPITTLNAPKVLTIGDNCFKNCKNISGFNFPLAKTIGAGAFSDCIGLEELILENKEMTVGENAFENCTALKTFVADGVTEFDLSILEGCEKLDTLSLNSITSLGDFSFSADNTMGTNWPLLKNFSADSLISAPQYMFYNSVDVKNVSMDSLETIEEYTFEGSGLTDADFPGVIVVEDYAFYHCVSLKTVSLDKATVLGKEVFSQCPLLNTIKLNALTEIPVFDDYIYDFKDYSQLVNFEADSLGTVPESMFDGCTGLNSVSFNGASEIGAYAFRNSGVSITSFDSLKTISNNAFEGCLNLTDFDFPQLIYVGDYAFKDTALTSVCFDTETELGIGVFNGCYSIIEFNFYWMPNLTLESLTGGTSLASEFSLKKFSCNGLTSVPDSFFKSCSNLNTVYLPDIAEVGREAFSGCSALENVTMPNIKFIGEKAFYNCTYFNPSKIASLVEEIESSALSGTAISGNVDFANLKVAYEKAFSGITLSNVTFPNIEYIYDLPECDYIAIGSLVKDIDYCTDISSTVFAVTGTPVLAYSNENNLGWKPFNSSTPIITNTKENQFYANRAVFEVIGFNVEYKWYYATKPDLSDSEEICNNTFTGGKIADISNIYGAPFVYCVATSSENGNVVEIKSNIIKIISNSFETFDELSYFDRDYIYTDRTDVTNDLDIFTLKDGFSYFALPSYVAGDIKSYGTGSTIYIYYQGKPLYSFTEVMFGDLTGDGVVDVIDAVILNNHFLGVTGIEDDSMIIAADTDMNNQIDALDYQAVINKILA